MIGSVHPSSNRAYVFSRGASFALVPLEPGETELSVEREVGIGAARRVVRLTVRLPDASAGSAPDAIAVELRRLQASLDAAMASAGLLERPERDLAELVETYRPRQPELIELLRAEGELTEREGALLRAHLAGAETPTLEPAGGPATDSRSTGSRRTGARVVAELLATYQIASLKQAGAVRARRQISYDEYMALKRHFAPADAEAAAASDAR